MQRCQRRRCGVEPVPDAGGLDDGVVERDLQHFTANGCDHRAAFSFALYLRRCSAASASACAMRAIIGARQQ